MDMVERTIKIRGYTIDEEVDDGRGNMIPHSRLARRGEVVELTEADAAEGDKLGYFYPPEEDVEEDGEPVEAEVPDMSDDELDLWIAGEESDSVPTVQDVLEAADGDAENAERLLASENRVAAANKRDVRAGVEKGLADIIGSAS